MKTPENKSANRLENYLRLSKSVVSKPVPHADKVLGVSMALALFGALQNADAQIVYSGVQNVPCALAGASNRCYANIDLAGGNDFEFHRNHVSAMVFIQVDEVLGGGFDINGFNAQVAGGYVYPYALAANAVIGPAGPWGFQAGQANSLSDNGFYPNHKWETLPAGTTRFLGIRGTKSGGTKYGWIRLTKNAFGNYTIVDWAYNNLSNTQILAGQTVSTTAANVNISGRVLTPDGRGLPNAIVTLTDSNGQTRLSRTSSFGYFRIDGVEAGQSVVVSVSSKSYDFDAQVLDLTDNVQDLSFTGRDR